MDIDGNEYENYNDKFYYTVIINLMNQNFNSFFFRAIVKYTLSTKA